MASIGQQWFNFGIGNAGEGEMRVIQCEFQSWRQFDQVRQFLWRIHVRAEVSFDRKRDVKFRGVFDAPFKAYRRRVQRLAPVGWGRGDWEASSRSPSRAAKRNRPVPVLIARYALSKYLTTWGCRSAPFQGGRVTGCRRARDLLPRRQGAG